MTIGFTRQPARRHCASILILVLTTGAGCATIFSGTKQSISVNSNVKGAKVLFNGVQIGTTPFNGQITRAKQGTIVVSKKGYQEQIYTLSTSVEPIFWGNILCGGTLGSTTDSATGAMWEYSPNTFYADLERDDSSSLDLQRQRHDGRIRFFVLHNYDGLTRDIASGRGDYLAALREAISTGMATTAVSLGALREAVKSSRDAPELAELVLAAAR